MLSDALRSLPLYADLLERARRGEDRLVVAGGVGELPGLLLATAAGELGRPIALVVGDEKEAERLRQDLSAGGLTRIFHAPSPALTPYQRILPSLKARREEFGLLAALKESGGIEAVVLPARSLFTRPPSAPDLEKPFVSLAQGAQGVLSRLLG